MLLEDALPHWRHRERHRITVGAPRDVVMAAISEVTWGDVPVFRLLLSVRGLGRTKLPADQQIVGFLTRKGFSNAGGWAILDRADEEFVVGVLAAYAPPAAVRPLSDPPEEVFRTFDLPGFKAAMNFRYAGGVLTTETRILPTDALSERKFRAYWFFIRPFSGLIRRIWLRAIRRRALAQTIR